MWEVVYLSLSTFNYHQSDNEETTQRLDQAERSLLFLTAAGAVCQIGDHGWYGMCVLTLAMLATGTQGKDASGTQGGGYHMGERTGASQEAYRLEAYDCSKPEDAIIYSIPQSCPMEKEGASTQKLSQTTQQNYTILEEVATFDYPATLCTVHQSRGYYDCVWKSHVSRPRFNIPTRECVSEQVCYHQALRDV